MELNWLDIIIVLIVGWYAWLGFRAGLVGGLARLMGVFAGLAAAFNFHRPLSDWLNLKWNLASLLGKTMPVSAFGPRGKLPGSGEILYPAQGLPGPQGTLLSPKGAIYGLQGVGESVSRFLASGLIDILCFIAIFLVVSKAVVILGVLIGKAARLFLLGPVDRFGGAVLGILKGSIIALVLVALIGALEAPAALFSGGYHANWVSSAMQKSVLVPYFTQALVVLNLKFPGWSI